MQIGERVNQARADLVTNLRIIADLRGNGLSDNDSAPPLHQIKRRPDHALVFAQQVWFRRELKMRVDRGEQAVFSRHVVRGRGDWTERRPAHHELTVSEANAVGQV